MLSETEIPLIKESINKLKDLGKQFKSVSFPIVRRVFPSLIANQIVSVQPMSAPSGLIFYTDYQYSKDSKPIDYKLKKGKIYKVMWNPNGPFSEFIDLYKQPQTGASTKIGQVPNGALLIYLGHSEKQNYFRVFYGDQVGWIWANQVWGFRFKRITARMVRRHEGRQQ